MVTSDDNDDLSEIYNLVVTHEYVHVMIEVYYVQGREMDERASKETTVVDKQRESGQMHEREAFDKDSIEGMQDGSGARTTSRTRQGWCRRAITWTKIAGLRPLQCT